MQSFKNNLIKKLGCRFVAFLAVSAFFLLSTVSALPADAAKNEMLVHAIYLGSQNDTCGDSTLLESDGEYLLVDCGSPESAPAIVAYLKNLGVTRLQVLISHMHFDHRGGLLSLQDNFNITKVYLPDKSYGSEYAARDKAYTAVLNASKNSAVTYLKTGNSFSVGAISAKVLGPKGSYRLSDFKDTAEGQAEGHYYNNYSLVTMFTGGGTRYLSAGDIETEEESALLKTYKKGELKADVFKVSHHGLKTSNSESFLKAVSPSFSFLPNCGHAGVGPSGYYKTYTSLSRAIKYGPCVMLGEEETDFVFYTSNGKASLYRGGYTYDSRLKDWITLRGGDGTNRKYDAYYLTLNGSFLTGVNRLSGKAYYFDDTGRRVVGSYSDGVYNGWRGFGGRYRFFKENGEMYVGFKTVNRNRYYFEYDTGFRKVGDGKYTPQKIGEKTYAINNKGVIYCKGWYRYDDGYRYFDSDGEMKIGWLTIGGNRFYLSPDTGFRKQGFQKIDSRYYYFSSSGAAVKNYWLQSGNQYRYFDKNGMMLTGWQTIGSGRYYFNPKTGYAKTGLQKINNYYYWFSNTGIMFKKGFLKDSKTGKIRYFASSGAMLTGWRTVGKKRYYFDTKTGLSAGGHTKIGGKYYYFDPKTGVLKKNAWVAFKKQYRYYGSTGIMATGMRTLNNKRYYFDPKTGYTVSGGKVLSGKAYYFNPSSKYHEMMKNKWVKKGSGYVYYGSGGVRRSGWATLNKKRYYFSPKSGLRATGPYNIDGTLYYFGADGVLQKNKTVAYKGLKLRLSNAGRVKDCPTLNTKIYNARYTSGGTALSWKKSVSANGYKIYMQSASGGEYKVVATVKSRNTVRYTVKLAKRGSYARFAVRAYKKIGGVEVLSEYSSVKRPK